MSRLPLAFLLTIACALGGCSKDDNFDDGSFSLRAVRACHTSWTTSDADDFWVRRYGANEAAFRAVELTLAGGEFRLASATCAGGVEAGATAQQQEVRVSFDRWVNSLTLQRGDVITGHTYNTIQRRAIDLVDTTAPPVVTYFLETSPAIEELDGVLWVCADRLLFEQTTAAACHYGWRKE